MKVTEKAIYQDFGDHVVQPFKIPDHWERFGGADFGIRDFTVLLMGAVDPDKGILYIYDEYYKNALTVPKHAEAMKELLADVPYGRLRTLVADPSGKRRNIADMRSLFDHYGEYGVYFKDGNNRIEAGIAKVQAYFTLGRLKIFSSCVNTIREGLAYKYKPMELDSDKNISEEPLDKDNHAMDSLRYLVNELPDNPDNLKAQSFKPSNYYGKTEEDGSLPFALREDNKQTSDISDWYKFY